MAGIDTSIYNALMTKPKSVSDYLAEYDQRDLQKQQLQQNALALKSGQMQMADRERSLQRQNALLGLTGSWKADTTDDQRATDLKNAGFFSEADALEKQFVARRETQSKVDKSNFETARDKLALTLQVLGGVKDQNSYAAGIQRLAQAGIDVSKEPQQFDPAYVASANEQALTQAQRLEQAWKQKGYDLDVRKQSETERSNKAGESIQIRGQNLTDARGREEMKIKAAEGAAGGKPPPGFRWKGDGTLEAIPGGPGDKLPEAQQKQVVGVQNLRNAIQEYRTALASFEKWNTLSPDERAKMGTKYQNMLLQAKEAYNLGVLNGPDYEILQSVITSPLGFKGAITSRSALDQQASELDRIMSGVATTSSNRRPQDGATPVNTPAVGGASFADAEKERRYQEWKARQGK